MAKVFTVISKPNKAGQRMRLVATFSTNATIEHFLKRVNLTMDQVERYEVSANMPLPNAIKLSEKLMRLNHLC